MEEVKGDSNIYQFMQTLAVHTGAVRSVAVQGDAMMSGSIDMTNKMYNYNSGSGRYDFDKEVKYHDGFVLNIIPEITGNGFLSAGRDNKILHIDNHGTPILEFNGH